MARIAVVGATGYTGRLIAHELDRRGLAPVLIGRSRERLEALAGELGREAEPRTASVLDPEALVRALDEDVGVAINTVGPFLRFGDGVVRAAVEAGAHYLDTTGEQAYMARVAEAWDAEARRHRVAVMCATSFEYAIGDCLGAMAVDALGGEADAVALFYRVSGASWSRGTQKSIVGALARPVLERQGGELVRRRVAAHRTSVHFPDEDRPRSAISFPGGEALHLPERQPVDEVRSYMAVTDRIARTVQLTSPSFAALRIPGIAGLAQRLADRGPTGPDDAEREASRFALLARASRDARTHRVLARGRDPYGLTADVAAEVAQRLSEGRGPARYGVTSTAAAFDPAELLGSLPAERLRVEHPDGAPSEAS